LLAGTTNYEYQRADAAIITARDRLIAIASAYKVDLRAAALQFCAAHPVVASVIPGTKTPQRVRENVTLSRQMIPESFWFELDTPGKRTDAYNINRDLNGSRGTGATVYSSRPRAV
jgi:D-threo-aldose 1-dehydrogenase